MGHDNPLRALRDVFRSVKIVVGGVLVGIGVLMNYAGQGITYTGDLIEALGNRIGDPL